jgi:hypothetical protein
MGTDDAPRECGCRQPDCFACEIASLRAWLLLHGLHIVSAAERAILKAANDFYDARLVLDDERTFDALMAAVHASREGNGTHTTG